MRSREKSSARLRGVHEAIRENPGEDTYVQTLTLRSLKRMINQMTEEIARFESRQSPPASMSTADAARS